MNHCSDDIMRILLNYFLVHESRLFIAGVFTESPSMVVDHAVPVLLKHDRKDYMIAFDLHLDFMSHITV